jgi:hypothetical protein
MINSERCFVGVACTFGKRVRNDGHIFAPEMFKRFLDLEMGLPLRVEHGSLLTSKGAIRYVGAVRKFHVIDYPVHGLLILAELHDDPAGWSNELLHDLAAIASQQWLPQAWALSIGAHIGEGTVLPYEISLTQSPADHDAKILAVGAEAITTFELLSEVASTRLAAG